MKSLSITSAPTLEPVTISEALSYLRVDDTGESPIIGGFITVAREVVEHFTGRALITQSWRLSLSEWPSDCGGSGCAAAGRIIELERTPLISVESVKYYPADGSAQATLSASAYIVVTDAKPGLICLKSDETWPDLADRPDAVQIAFTAGATAPAAVPAALRHAVLMLVSHLYENRDVATDVSVNQLPFSLKHLLESQRVGGWVA